LIPGQPSQEVLAVRPIATQRKILTMSQPLAAVNDPDHLLEPDNPKMCQPQFGIIH